MVLLTLSGCGGLTVNLPDEIGPDFEIGSVLDDLRDCDVLSKTFVAVVREAAEDIDALAEASGGRVPAAELTSRVDALTGTAYFEVAERLGCNAVSQRVETIDRLRDLSPDTLAGEDLVGEVISQLEAQGS
jgi:hypothetical protein